MFGPGWLQCRRRVDDGRSEDVEVTASDSKQCLTAHARDCDWWRLFKVGRWLVEARASSARSSLQAAAAAALVAREAGALRELLAAVAAAHARVHAQVVRQAAALREAAPALRAREGPLPGMDTPARPTRGSKGNTFYRWATRTEGCSFSLTHEYGPLTEVPLKPDQNTIFCGNGAKWAERRWPERVCARFEL